MKIEMFLCFNSNRVKLRLLTAVLLLASFQTVLAQNVFKVGDRVMVSPSSLKDEKYWRPGTITEVHNFTPKKAYSVSCDPQSTTDHPSTFMVNEDWVRPLKAKNAEVKTDNNPKITQPPAANQNNKIACPSSDPDSKGATEFERLIRGAIRVGFERTPQLNEDGKVTVSFQNINIGQSHMWRQLEDPMDARGKTIYEVRSTFTTCTDYFRRIEFTKRERAFACYKNNAGEWVCEVVAAANTNVKDQTKSVDKPNR